MDNHQAELGDHLAAMKAVVSGLPAGVTVSGARTTNEHRLYDEIQHGASRCLLCMFTHLMLVVEIVVFHFCLVSCLTMLQVCAAPDQLLSAVQQLDSSARRPFPVKNTCGIVDSIDDFMGRHRAQS